MGFVWGAAVGALAGIFLVGVLAHRKPELFNRIVGMLVGPVNWVFGKINALIAKARQVTSGK